MSSRIDVLRSKEAGCRWAAQLVRDDETRRLFTDIARQYRELADQLELIDKLLRHEVGESPLHGNRVRRNPCGSVDAASFAARNPGSR